ncbi:MAG: hypothetical protein IJ861_00555 [Clostridia bacterium]|nr:hypothetical protein [Clostridia bacterium]
MLYLVMGICGIVGGLLCCVGDILLDKKGSDNQKLGEHKLINSAWEHMNPKRFSASIAVGAVAVPLYGLGLLSLALQTETNAPEIYSLIFKLVIYVGQIGALLVHTFLCLVPIAYLSSKEKGGFDTAEHTINELFRAVAVPLHIYYYILGLGPTVMLVIGLCLGYFNFSPWWLLITPIPLILVSSILRKINPKIFCDIPGIFAGSLGMGMYGLLAMINWLG